MDERVIRLLEDICKKLDGIQDEIKSVRNDNMHMRTSEIGDIKEAVETIKENITRSDIL